MSRREILITDPDTAVDVVCGVDGEPARVSLGSEDTGVTLVGDLEQIHRLIVEADRQVSRLVVRAPSS